VAAVRCVVQFVGNDADEKLRSADRRRTGVLPPGGATLSRLSPDGLLLRHQRGRANSTSERVEASVGSSSKCRQDEQTNYAGRIFRWINCVGQLLELRNLRPLPFRCMRNLQ